MPLRPLPRCYPVRQQDTNFAFGFGSTQAIDSQGETVSDGCSEIFLQGLGIDHALQGLERFQPGQR